MYPFRCTEGNDEVDNFLGAEFQNLFVINLCDGPLATPGYFQAVQERFNIKYERDVTEVWGRVVMDETGSAVWDTEYVNDDGHGENQDEPRFISTSAEEGEVNKDEEEEAEFDESKLITDSTRNMSGNSGDIVATTTNDRNRPLKPHFSAKASNDFLNVFNSLKMFPDIPPSLFYKFKIVKNKKYLYVINFFHVGYSVGDADKDHQNKFLKIKLDRDKSELYSTNSPFLFKLIREHFEPILVHEVFFV